MLIAPDVPDLPYTLHNVTKYFELVAEPVRREILSGLFINAWGYNGSMPGPTIQVYPGDYVSIRVINKLPEPTSIHWHGLDVPNGMDGVPDVEPSPKIDPGNYLDYHFKITNPPGTHMYHTHFYTVIQEMMGLRGAFIILDPNRQNQYIHRDYFLMLQEFHVNGLKMGENARIRLGNIVHNAHPIHIHGHQFVVSASDGNNIPVQNRLMKTTINVTSGETYDLEFKANNPGIWPFHCHIPHHMSNNMQKSMGGMSTVIVYRQ